jgi:hypothetical protein
VRGVAPALAGAFCPTGGCRWVEQPVGA